MFENHKFIVYTFILFIFSVIFSPVVFPEEGSGDSSPNLSPAPYESTEFSLWMHDLRRFEIVFFGTLPFSFFYSSIGYSFYTYAYSGWDNAYAPAILGNSTPPILTNSEKLEIIKISLGLSASAAAFDFILGKVFK